MKATHLRQIQAIRNAAMRLEKSTDYQWGHMGACNCGFLAQEVTKLSREEIHRRAMTRHGDWSEQLNEYCPSSGLAVDDMISDLIQFGFEANDLRQLERLSDPNILATLSPEERILKFNVKGDVAKYMKTWANLLEDELVKGLTLPLIQILPVPESIKIGIPA